MTSRPYTGNKDAVHAAKREGTKVFVDYCCYLFGVTTLAFLMTEIWLAPPHQKSLYMPPGVQ
jgi:hypothetical protein